MAHALFLIIGPLFPQHSEGWWDQYTGEGNGWEKANPTSEQKVVFVCLHFEKVKIRKGLGLENSWETQKLNPHSVVLSS